MPGPSTAALLTTMIVSSAASKAVTSVGQGYAAGAQDSYNATIAGLKGQALQVQDQITQGQYVRKAGQLLSTQTATAGAAGIEPTGSVAAVMLDSQTQINTDMAIAHFNNQLEQNYASSEVTQANIAQKSDITAGYTNAFSDILQGGEQAALYNSPQGKTLFNTGAGAKTASGV